jgi:hypothetical protein
MFDVFSLFESFGMKRRMVYERMDSIVKNIELECKVNYKKAEILTALRTSKDEPNGYINPRPLKMDSKNLKLSKS